jgi:hypothetical protein
MRRLVVLACALALNAPAFAQPTPQARLATYRERVERLEDADAIENLQASWGYYFDKGLWDDAVDLFAADGTFEYGQRGVYVGREHIRRALLLFGPKGLGTGRLNNHMQLQPVITVAPDGKTATARWQGMVMLSEPGANGVWGVGLYENAYAKVRGVWQIAKLHFYVTAMADYDGGFSKSPLRMEGQSALYPPDRPPSENYRAFPSAYVPQFSYVHPVTGKPIVVAEPADSVARPAP